MTRRPVQYRRRSLELEWQQEHLKDGKHILLRMIGDIDKKIQDVIKEIIAKEFEEQIHFKPK